MSLVAGFLLVVLELLLLALAGADLGAELALLTPAWRAVVPAAAAALLLPLFARRVRRALPRAAVQAALVLGVAVAGAAGLTLVVEAASRRLVDQWDLGANERLEARARLLEEDARWFLDAMVASFAEPLPDLRRSQTAFAWLETQHDRSPLPSDRLGLALYSAEGAAIAWTGNSTPPPADLLTPTAPASVFAVAGSEETPRLYAVRVDPFTGVRRIAEFLLRPPPEDPTGDPEPGARFEFLPHWPGVGPARLQVRFGREDPDALAGLFQVQGDRHWWRAGRQRLLSLTLPLRAPGGHELLTATLQDRRAFEELTARSAVARRLSILLLALGVAAAAALANRRLPHPAAGLLLGVGAIAALRWLLLLIAPDHALPPLSIYDVTLYASSRWGGLLRSPADLLLTAIAALGVAWLVRGTLASLDRPARPAILVVRRLLAGLAALGAAAAAFEGLHLFLDHVVLDARIDLTRIDWDAACLPRLALQSGLFLAVAAAGIVVVALAGVAFGGDAARRPGATAPVGLPPALRAVLFTLAVTGLYVPLLQHSYGRLRREFFESDLMQRVLYQSVGRATELRDSLRLVDEGWFEAAAGYDDDQESPGSLAYRLWSRTPLAAMGLSSSLRLLDEEGREISRFAVNLGIMFEPRFAEAREAAGAEPIALPPREGVTLRKAVLFGSRWIDTIGSPRRLLVLTVIDDYDNVPLVGAEAAYLPLLRSHALPRTNPELLRFEPFVAVFGPGLERLYESGGEIPAPSPVIVGRLERRPFVWSDETVGEGPARILYFRGRGETFALAHLRRDLVGSLAAWLRLSILNGLVLFLAHLAARAVGGIGGARLPPLVPAGSFYYRLTTTFLVTALAPLLSLAWFATRYSARESERNLVASGLASLQTVRRVAEDYLNLPDPGYGRNLDNEVVFWLSRVVRQDINLYRGADLVATSTPELYGSALLNRRLDGSVFEALYLDREPFRLARARVAGLDYRTLSAPMRLDPQGTIGVVSIPLAAQSRAVARRAEELGDAILISSCLTVALLALVGWIVARRVSGPIASLAGASRRVAAGDLEARVGSRSRDELGVLVESFNSMAESLQRQRQDLSRRSEYIETILARATTGVLSLDARGAVITINPAAQQLLARGERMPQPGDDLAEQLVEAPRLQPFAEALERSLEGRLEGEVSLRLGTGEEDRRLRAVFLPFSHGDALPGRIVIVEDVTDIVRSGRLAAWAEMARRIAHEVKNPLTPIQLSVEHVRRLWRANDPRFGTVLQECLDNIQGQVRALRQIATEFSAYARLPRLRPEVISVETLLTEALAPYAAAAPPGVTLARVVEPDLPPLYLDRAVIGRVLVNLVENALQAMPHGGRLEVGASLRPHPPGRRAGGAEGRSVRLVVRDTGTGIEPDILARIYEPYFSTKSGGTGLGLAIARNAVEEHGGTIEIESRPGAGTTVTVDLPVPAAGAGALAAG